MSGRGGLPDLLRDLIAHEGPIGLDRFMALALGHPVYGYYATRDPLGAAGDFTTAPEISQMFGELLGLWAAEAWRQVGAPELVRLVELGPGRGTLMTDLFRVARLVPPFRAALDVHLVETSRHLRDKQAAGLSDAGIPIAWHDGLETVPDGPVLVIANEFFDALPVRHYCRSNGDWRERLVGLGLGGDLIFGLAPDPEPSLTLPAPDGAILEVGIAAQRLMQVLAERLVRHGGAALVIDYGHVASGFGETLQAVRRHRRTDPLQDPGQADLSAHVDFAALAKVAAAAGASVHGPVTQGSFLRDLGIAARAERLGASHPRQAEAIGASLRRLTEPSTGDEPGMGELFKVLAVTAPGAPIPPGFPPAGPTG